MSQCHNRMMIHTEIRYNFTVSYFLKNHIHSIGKIRFTYNMYRSYNLLPVRLNQNNFKLCYNAKTEEYQLKSVI